MFPANSHVIRQATTNDVMALLRLAAASGHTRLTGRILVAEVDGVIAAALSRDEKRSIADPELAPPYLLAMLQLRAYAFAAAEREPDLAERLREAVLGPRPARTLPRAA